MVPLVPPTVTLPPTALPPDTLRVPLVVVPGMLTAVVPSEPVTLRVPWLTVVAPV